MKDDDLLTRSLAELGDPALPEALGTRTLARATAWLEPPSEAAWRVVMGRLAVPALLVSATVVFAADTCAMILRVFGG
jgi:hypothetical protein